MEDFQAAFLKRSEDVMVLDSNERHTAAMHFGGVAIECLLKHILCTCMPRNSRGKKEWKTESNNPGHTIENPGHSFFRAIGHARQYNQRLQRKFQQHPQVMQWLQDVETPLLHFIDLRYHGSEPDIKSYQQWYRSYNSLKRWLEQNGVQSGKE